MLLLLRLEVEAAKSPNEGSIAGVISQLAAFTQNIHL